MKYLIFFFFIVPGGLTAQIVFEKTYGGPLRESAQSVQQTIDGGYVLLGHTDGFGASGYDLYLIKTDSVGGLVWSNIYGGSGTDIGRSVQQTADGGYILVGYTNSFGAGGNDIYLIKTNSIGGVVWSKTFGDSLTEYGHSVQQTSDGGYIILGDTWSFTPGYSQFYLIKVDASGNKLWEQNYGCVDYDYGRSVQQTADSGYILLGFTDCLGAGAADFYLIKTNSIGGVVWSQTYGGTSPDYGYSVWQTADSGYVLCGWTYVLAKTAFDAWLIKTDVSGATVWSKTYGGANTDGGNSVEQTLDGGYIIAGETNSFGPGNVDLWLIKVDMNGDTIWTKTYGQIDADVGYSVQQTTDGGYVVVGGRDTSGVGLGDVYLIKTDSVGSIDTSVVIGFNQSRLLEWVDSYPLDARVIYYDLVGRIVPFPGLLLPGQLYITTVYSSAGRLLGRKLQLAIGTKF